MKKSFYHVSQTAQIEIQVFDIMMISTFQFLKIKKGFYFYRLWPVYPFEVHLYHSYLVSSRLVFSKLSIARVSFLASFSCLICCVLQPLCVASWALQPWKTCYCFPPPTPKPTHSFFSSDLYPHFFTSTFASVLRYIFLNSYYSLLLHLHNAFPSSSSSPSASFSSSPLPPTPGLGPGCPADITTGLPVQSLHTPYSYQYRAPFPSKQHPFAGESWAVLWWYYHEGITLCCTHSTQAAISE